MSAGEPRSPEDLTFEAFFERERDGLFGAMCLITANRSEAEDVLQEAFLSLFERWERVRRLEDPTGYLYRAALNAYRSRGRRARVALKRVLGPPSAKDDFAQAEARHVLRRALARLTPRQRAALVLTELLQFTSEEAGAALGIRAVTVRALASQGRAAMKKLLEVPDE